MDTRSNKVRYQTFKILRQPSKLCCRHLDSVDRDQWHGYGVEFPGSRWLRSYLVGMLNSPALRVVADKNRDFVSHVQQQLMALGPGRSPPNAALATFVVADESCHR